MRTMFRSSSNRDAARVLASSVLPTPVKQEIEDTRRRMEEAERNYDLEQMARLKYDALPRLEKQLEEERQRVDAGKEDRLLKEEVGEEEIAGVVSKWTGIPVSKLVESEKEKLLRLPEILHRRVPSGGGCPRSPA